MAIEIKPVRVFPEYATQALFEQIIVTPRESVKGVYVLLNEDGKQLVSGNVEMTHEQYVLWGTEDSYLEDCFLFNLGLERSL